MQTTWIGRILRRIRKTFFKPLGAITITKRHANLTKHRLFWSAYIFYSIRWILSLEWMLCAIRITKRTPTHSKQALMITYNHSISYWVSFGPIDSSILSSCVSNRLFLKVNMSKLLFKRSDSTVRMIAYTYFLWSDLFSENKDI